MDIVLAPVMFFLPSVHTMNKRPLSITFIGYLFVVTGIVGIGYHATEFNPRAAFDLSLVLVLVVRFLAIVGGVFALHGANWARWLLLVWIAYHVFLSAYHSVSEFAVHSVLIIGVAYYLFRARGSAYFQG